MYLIVGDYCLVSIINEKIKIELEDMCWKVLDLSDEFPLDEYKNVSIL